MRAISISGNLESLKKSVINELEALYNIDIYHGDFLPEELAVRLADITGRIKREIAIYLNRKGQIIDVSVGDSSTVSLAEVEGRRNKARLTGIRCIHTHPNGDGKLSAVDINALLKLKLDAMVALGVENGKVNNVYAALSYTGLNVELNRAEIFGPFKLGSSKLNELLGLIEERDRKNKDTSYINKEEKERCILVGLEISSGRVIDGKSEGERSLDELKELVYTAGAVVVRKILQKRSSRDSAYYIGRGKVEELNLLQQALNVDAMIFDHELSGAQFRNIEETMGIKVVDRTTLILDIFAQRAQSREGKLQVELAQLKYRLPRLTGMGSQLSRLGGGIGTRGPGEKKLEVDRRHIRRRIKYLEEELEAISKRRGLVRSGRRKNDLPTIALVGYTNAGKSTLMNILCGADVFAENKLFATLDPTTRRLSLMDGRDALLIDTVGFIRKLPHELIEAFKSTLEEVVYADALIHVVDASSGEVDEQIEVVKEILCSLGLDEKPVLLALNKVDLLESEARIPTAYSGDRIYEVSAATGEGLHKLINGVSEAVPVEEVQVELLVPYNQGWVLAFVHENGKVLEERFSEAGVELQVEMNKKNVEKINQYLK